MTTIYQPQFVTTLPAGSQPILALENPTKQWVLLKSLSLKEMAHPTQGRDAFNIFFGNDEKKTLSDLQSIHEPGVFYKKFEQDSARVFYSPDHAVIISKVEQPAAYPGLIYFSFYAKQLEKLEQEMEECLNTLKKDAPLTKMTKGVNSDSSEHVDSTREKLTHLRLDYLRIHSCFAVPKNLSEESDDLLHQLIEEFSISERCEVIEKQLETCIEFYDLLGDRISEYSYFYREYKVEVLIVVILLVEVVLTVMELF